MKWFLALTGLMMLALAGCDDSNTGTGNAALNGAPATLNENAFATDPGLVATADQVVIVHLEHPNDVVDPQEDTGQAGIDRIPIWYSETQDHLFSLEVWQGDLFSLSLYDDRGRELLFLDKNNPQATLNLDPGRYTLELRHGGGANEPRTLFIRPGSTKVSYNCPSCDLSRQNFRSANLKKANLYMANLTEADLSEANLTEANMEGADLTRAKLQWAVLVRIDLFVSTINGADFSAADLTGALLHYAMMGYSNLSAISFSHATLTGASLYNIDLRQADLRHADLTNADLGHANLHRADLRFTILNGTDLSHANLVDADLQEANLTDTNLSYADLNCADLRAAVLTNVNFTGADLSSAVWIDSHLCGNPSIGGCK